uniref:Calcium binding protein 39 n=1 Tax=Echinococcus canadensis TaxID=519352 RepID=A0A915EXC4_9CEST
MSNQQQFRCFRQLISPALLPSVRYGLLSFFLIIMPIMPMFNKHKQPREHIAVIYDSLLVLDNVNKNDKERRKAVEEIARALSSLKEALVERSDSRVSGKDKDTEFSNAERARISEIISEVTQEIINRDMVPLILAHLDAIEFESCKQIVELFGHILRKPARPFNPMVRYLCEHPEILATLLKGYNTPETAIHFGAILRDACRNENITKLVLGSPGFYDLFGHVQGTAFDISSDAFATLRDLLTRHKPEVADFLINNYDVFFKHYLTMLTSENYVTKRQALKLLGELLLDRHNSEIMNRYIADPENLKLMMNLLKSKEKQIAFETFHCFKVFVASPTKSRPVHMILYQNRDKLISFLENFQNDRQDDMQFNDEKKYLIKQIMELRPLAPL